MRKIEVGKSRPTENFVTNSLINDKVTEWQERIREAQEVDGVNAQIEAGATVLFDLIKQVKANQCEREVLSALVGRMNLGLSLQRAIEKGVRQGCWLSIRM